MKAGPWIYDGDVNLNQFGGRFVRRLSDRVFQEIEVHVPDSKTQLSRYAVTLANVDLTVTNSDYLRQARECCDVSNDCSDLEQARAYFDWCGGDRVHEWEGNNLRKLLTIARRMARP